MTKMSELAINECVAEMRAACRRPIDPLALEMVTDWVRADFARMLDRIDGPQRWAEAGARVREVGRHLGAFADFFASREEATTVSYDALVSAVTLARADCTVRAERTPLAMEFCPSAPVNVRAAQEFLRAMAPAPELVEKVG